MTKSTIIFILIVISFTETIFGQVITERLIITDNKDSTYIKAESMNFDINGNYLFEIKSDKGYFFIGNTQKIGPVNFNWGSSISQFTSMESKDQKYYMCSSSKLFGPFLGSDIANYRHPISENLEHFSIPSLIKDSIAIYIDGEIKMKIDTISNINMSINSKKVSSFEAKKNSFESADWMNFSNSGNYIFSAENGLVHRLFLNGKQIDSSQNKFYQLRVNNNGDYLYAKGRLPLKGEDNNYDYMFYIHTKDTVLGPVRTVWNCDLKENGGYYYSGDDNGTSYIVINNILHKKLKSLSNIIIIDINNYLFTYIENGINKICVNGKVFTIPFDEIYFPSLDNKGNFAFYGIKNYYLYTYVSGVQSANPISKYDVRPIPLYIHPDGSSLHYFKTDDSTYLYQDNKLLFPAFSNSTKFSVQLSSEILPHSLTKSEASDGKNLFYIEIDTVGYFVFNGQFSKPMIPAKEHSYEREKKIGEIVAGKLDINGFFAIQKIAQNKFLVNINNKIYKEIEGVWEIVKNCNYFDGKKLTFYGIKGLSFYQYTLTQ